MVGRRGLHTKILSSDQVSPVDGGLGSVREEGAGDEGITGAKERPAARDQRGPMSRENDELLPFDQPDGPEIYDHVTRQQRSHANAVDFPSAVIWIQDQVYHHGRRVYPMDRGYHFIPADPI